MDLLWYFNRLRAMSPLEIGYRAQKLFYAYRLKRHAHRPIIPSIVDSSKFPFIELEIEKLRETLPTFVDKSELLNAANSILQHCIPLFIGDCHQFAETIDWQIDPVSGNQWEKIFSHDIHYQTFREDRGGIRFVWEFNRHHHFLILGQAYCITGDQRYAKEMCDQFQSWAEQNPPYYGVNWLSPLEFSIRIINWIWGFSFIRDSQHLSDTLLKELLRLIYLQTDLTSHSLSLYSSANNHLIGEAAQLAIVGMLFPSFPEAEKWRERGFQILQQEIKKQIHPDGVGKEQAISYLAFVIDFYLQVDFFSRQCGIDPPIDLGCFEPSLEFLSSVVNCNGQVPQIGDSDDGFVFKGWVGPPDNYRSLLNTFSVVCERDDFRQAGQAFDAKSCYILGEKGYDAFKEMATRDGEKSRPVKSSCAFTHGGYYILRSGRNEEERILVLDCGELGYLSLAAHGHADCLSVAVSYGGEWLLVDTGTYLYHSGGKWRDYFRGTYAHNTVVIDGKDQSESRGPFVWGKKAATGSAGMQYLRDKPRAWGSHEGYAPVIHKRSVEFIIGNSWLITDDVSGDPNREHTIEVVYNLAIGDLVVKEDKSALFTTQDTGKYLKIRLESDTEKIDVKTFQGEENPIRGWYSPSFNEKIPAPMLIYSITTRLPFSIITRLECGKLEVGS